MPEWFVDASRTAVNWGTVMPALTPSVDIYRLVRNDHGGEQSYLWQNAGRPTTAARKAAAVAAASSDPVPARGAESRTQPTRSGSVSGDQIADGSVGVVDLAPDVKATIPLLTPAVSSAATGTLGAGATHRIDCTGGAKARTLQSAAAAGVGAVVVAKKLDTSANTLTLSPAGSDTINTVVGTRTLAFPREAVHLRSDGVSDWTVVASDTPRSALDATYAPITGSATYVQVLTPASTYTWNADGTLATVTLGGVTTAYTWNPDGTLASEARNGVTRAFTWNADGTLAAVA